MTEPLLYHEKKLLLVLAGKTKLEWGSWIHTAMAQLRGRGFAKSVIRDGQRQWVITDAGRAYLEECGL